MGVQEQSRGSSRVEVEVDCYLCRIYFAVHRSVERQGQDNLDKTVGQLVLVVADNNGAGQPQEQGRAGQSGAERSTQQPKMSCREGD